MKKTAILLTIILSAAALLSGCTQKTDRYAMTAEAPEELPAGIIEGYENPVYGHAEPLDPLNDDAIPLYREDDMILTPDMAYMLGVDYTQLKGEGSMPDSSSAYLYRFPKLAFRLREDGMMYTICDLNTGYRLIRLVHPDFEYLFTRGYIVVIAEEHSHRDFKGLKIGDPIQDVIKIDEATSLYYRQWMYTDFMFSAVRKYMGFNHWADEGWPYCTVHYLTDGLLKIEYRMLGDDQTIYITNTIYSPDRTLTDCEGLTLNYTIDERDLPY